MDFQESPKDPRLTGNDQYEDSYGKFTLNDVPSGIELFDAIRCHLWGIQKGYFRVSFDWLSQRPMRISHFHPFSEISRGAACRMEKMLQGSHL